MFGTLLFGMVPYAIAVDEETDEPFNPWVEQCKSDDKWEVEPKTQVDIRRCNDAS